MSVSGDEVLQAQAVLDEWAMALKRGGLAGLVTTLDTQYLTTLASLASSELQDRHLAKSPPCPNCKGIGRVPVDVQKHYWEHLQTLMPTCPKCNGSGKVL